MSTFYSYRLDKRKLGMIYALLVVDGAVCNTEEFREMFSAYMARHMKDGQVEGPLEYRLNGDLGSGAKLYIASGVYVGTYTEELTPDTQRRIHALNRLIREICEVTK